MKAYLILGLLIAAVCAEKKINLEDIERDNLKAEKKTKTESIQTDETKYAVKPNINQQQQYQIPTQYNTLSDHPESYIPPQPLQDVKYSQIPPERYIQPNQYAVQEAQYKQFSQIIPNVAPLQHYSGYQQPEIPARSVAPIAFESQKLIYQPEVTVGNQFQSVQQKAVTKTLNREPAYFNIPTAQLLSYYPHVDVNSLLSLRGIGLAQPLAGNTVQQISIPVYTPVYNQKQLFPSVKIPYSTVAPATFTTKITKGATYTLPVTSKKLSSASVLPTPVYVQPQQLTTQGKTLHTQAYQPQASQYVQQLVYTQPGIIYTDPTTAYSDLYASLPAYIQDNALRGQANQYPIEQQLYVTPTVASESPKEVPQEQISEDLQQNYVKVPEEPKTHFVPPQLPPQNFKSGVTQLEPVYSEEEQELPVQDYSLTEGPRSLLDSYIPSNVIVAQDSARYRERPIKLEGGFLPSKVNFAYKKHKSE